MSLHKIASKRDIFFSVRFGRHVNGEEVSPPPRLQLGATFLRLFKNVKSQLAISYAIIDFFDAF